VGVIGNAVQRFSASIASVPWQEALQLQAPAGTNPFREIRVRRLDLVHGSQPVCPVRMGTFEARLGGLCAGVVDADVAFESRALTTDIIIL
jgi:hypothetical protein